MKFLSVILSILLIGRQGVYPLSQALRIKEISLKKIIDSSSQSQRLFFNEEKQMITISNTKISLSNKEKLKIAKELQRIEDDLVILEAGNYLPSNKPNKTQLGKLMKCLSKNILLSERGYKIEE
ncbi:hypothetical protein GUI51_06730 [Enterococcus mundtii]|uniref:Uncharacterized protein n=1 Tax=Enterococcus mundtii TaxID=53346 RepID=A0ABQ0VGI9_ENTMU|nr:hypothetical protein [Enterococcus mundtii]GEN17527.1 hypothetical protein LAC02_08080 [Ligilactobacillus acidipiscis]AUB51781.1 hypothetical protein EM4838_01805 [Enterococcus mundtii]MDB7088865.1 hypothetical protein [Enterococcus mundtii]MZZ58815.1 hypothetical protein [Enterococcus mundtii]MZZ61649.1 hypothetical protein [Enterococcus mundtii]